MSLASEPTPARNPLTTLLRSPRMARAFALTTFGATFGTFVIERIAGRVALATIFVGLCAIAIAMLTARRDELTPMRLVPLSVVAFVGWAAASLAWTRDSTMTLSGSATLVALALLGVTLAHVRDTLQTVRALGDVLRALLGASVAIEVLSGVLLDTPLRFLGVQGNLAVLGPVQGVFGTRNVLGLVAVIAIVTFVIEWRTSSVRPGVALTSVVLAGGLAVLSDSPTVLVLAVVVGAVTGALVLVRRTPRRHRAATQWAVAAAATVCLIVIYGFRSGIVAFLGAGSDFSSRVQLWDTISRFVRVHPVQGWGWAGPWPTNEIPFNAINYVEFDSHRTALNAYVDVVLQLGWVGLALFVTIGVTSLVRSWLTASERRSVVVTWTPLIVAALLVDSVFESFTLTSFAWMLLVVCSVHAGQSNSWRQRVTSLEPEEPPL